MNSKLQQAFIDHFVTFDSFTTKQAYDWYQVNKGNPMTFAYRSNVYSVLLYPLTRVGAVKKIGVGIYKVVVVIDNVENNEWEQYINTKLKGSDSR